MQPKKQKPKKRVSFATAMVTKYDTEEPTQQIQVNMNNKTEAALTGSFIQVSPIPKGLFSSRTRINTTNDDQFLQNTFSTTHTTTHMPNLNDLYDNTDTISYNPSQSNIPCINNNNNNNNNNNMDIDNDNMSLTGTYEFETNGNT
eukprot:518506_1